MSRHQVEEVLGRALLEPDFRKAVLEDPDGATAAYDLTDEEREALRTVGRQQLAASGQLDERLAKTGFGLVDSNRAFNWDAVNLAGGWPVDWK